MQGLKGSHMIYTYITLADGTEIVHTHVFEEDGLQKVEVHFERPKEGGFDTARCQLPNYKWLITDGFTDADMEVFDQLVHSNAHLFYKYGANGGVKVGDNMCDKDKLKKITDDVVKAVLSVSNKVDSIILYGSQARGDSVEGSDIDILVIVNEPDEAIRGLRKAIWDHTNVISLEQDEVVSLVLKSRREYNRLRDTLFYQNVARDGIVLYSSVHPLDLTKMTEAELDEALEIGYQDVLAGRCRGAKEVFDELDRRIDAYFSNKSIKAPIDMGSLAKEELDAAIEKGMDSIRNCRGFTVEEVDAMLKKDFGI